MKHFHSLTQQLRSTLQPWQQPLFGPIWQLQHVHQLRNLQQQEQQLAIISDASHQKDHCSSFAWVITNQD